MEEETEEKIDELQQQVNELESELNRRTTGKNQLTMKAHDIQVRAQSEESSMEELAEICAEQMDEMTRRALVGEYQELEEENLFSHILED